MSMPHYSGSSSARSTTCTWWLRGSCKYGDSCKYLHGMDINTQNSFYQRGYNGSDEDYRQPSGFPLSPVARREMGRNRLSKVHEDRNMGHNTNDTPVYNFHTSPSGSPICRYWIAGNCMKAEECQFRHDPEVSQSSHSVTQNLTSAEEATGGGNWPLRTARRQRENDGDEIMQEFEPETFRTSTQIPVCSYWEAGDCARGEHCRFLHDPTITSADVFQVATSRQLEMALEKAIQEHERSLEWEKATHQATEDAAQEIQHLNEVFTTTLNSIEQYFTERLGRAHFELEAGGHDHEARDVAEGRQDSLSPENENGHHQLWLTQEKIDHEGRVAEARENHVSALEGANREYKRRLEEEAVAVEASKMAARERQRQLQALRNEEMEITEQYAVLGGSSLITCRAGVEVQSVVTGFDICRIIIKNLPRGTKHKEISDILVYYGMKSSDFFVHDIRFRPNCLEATVLVITDHGGEVAVGLEDTEFRDRTLTFEVSESPNGSTMGSSPRNVLNISWRVPHTAITATYKNVDEAERKARALNGKFCKGQRIRAEKKHLWTHSINLTGFPLGTSEDQVIRTFAGTTNIKSINSKSCTLEESFAMLLNHLRAFPNVETKSGSVNGEVRVKAYFENLKDTKRAHDSLNGKQLASNSPIFRTSLPSALQYKVIVALRQYEAEKRKWDALSENMTGSDAHVQITKKADWNTVLICVLGQDKKAVGSLKVRVDGMVAGERLDSHFWHPSFLSREGKAFFDHIYNKKKVYVRSDLKFRALRLYGETNALEEAREMIKEAINRLAGLETTVALDQKSIRFFIHQGLGQLQELVGEENAVLSFVPARGQWEITIKGGEEEKHHLNRLIRESKVVQTMEQIHPEKDEKVACPICSDEVSHPEKLGCGHIYCSGCLRHYLASAPEFKTFPLVCLGDESACKMPISLPLIRRFMTPQAFQALVEAAFRSYLDQHSQELKYCTTPDCQQIYRRSPETRILQCPSCFSSICSACEDEAHEGMTCKERLHQKDASVQERLLFNEWANGRGQRCPQCKRLIEKNGGCDHMTCLCGAKFQWQPQVFLQDGSQSQSQSQHNDGCVIQ